MDMSVSILNVTPAALLPVACASIIMLIRIMFPITSSTGNRQPFRHSLMDNIESMTIHIYTDGRYFAIGRLVTEADQTQTDILIQQLLDRAEELENEAERRMCEIHDRGILEELTPWMRRTGWIARFDGRNMKMLNDLLSEPKRNSQDPDKLRFVWESVERIMRQC